MNTKLRSVEISPLDNKTTNFKESVAWTDRNVVLNRRLFVKVLGAGLVVTAFRFPMLAQDDGQNGDAQNLADRWRFRLDPADSGIQERWFEQNLNQTFKLPNPCRRRELATIFRLIRRGWATS
jgi:hypothetical protein